MVRSSQNPVNCKVIDRFQYTSVVSRNRDAGGDTEVHGSLSNDTDQGFTSNGAEGFLGKSARADAGRDDS